MFKHLKDTVTYDERLHHADVTVRPPRRDAENCQMETGENCRLGGAGRDANPNEDIGFQWRGPWCSCHSAQSEPSNKPCLHEMRQDDVAQEDKAERDPIRMRERDETKKAA
jgi:hypothetical protein